MTREDEFVFFVDQLADCACQQYRKTDGYTATQEKLEEMDEAIEAMDDPDRRAFVEACLETVLDAEGDKLSFAYRQGLLDGVFVLKQLGALG